MGFYKRSYVPMFLGVPGLGGTRGKWEDWEWSALALDLNEETSGRVIRAVKEFPESMKRARCREWLNLFPSRTLIFRMFCFLSTRAADTKEDSQTPVTSRSRFNIPEGGRARGEYLY